MTQSMHYEDDADEELVCELCGKESWGSGFVLHERNLVPLPRVEVCEQCEQMTIWCFGNGSSALN